MNALTRRALIVAAFFVITGCGGGTGQNSLAPTSVSSLSANRLTTPVGVSPDLRISVSPTAIRHALRAAKYPTTKSLVFESNFSTKTVNIYKTAAIGSNPAPIATIAVPSGGCPYGMAVNKTKTLYLVDSCLSQLELYPEGSTTRARSPMDLVFRSA